MQIIDFILRSRAGSSVSTFSISVFHIVVSYFVWNKAAEFPLTISEFATLQLYEAILVRVIAYCIEFSVGVPR